MASPAPLVIDSPAGKTPKRAAGGEGGQKRPAPSLPPQPRRPAEKPLELNRYAASRGTTKGEVLGFAELVRSLGDLIGEKGNRQLLAIVLPRLALYQNPPASLVPELIRTAQSSEDRRLVRFVYYLLQLLLGSGCAGTPSPSAGEPNLPIQSLPPEISGRAWADVVKPETLAALADLQLKTLAAASRAIDGNRLDKHVAEAVLAILDRAEAGAGLAVGKKSKSQRRVHSDAWDLHWAALVAARNGMSGRAWSKVALRSSLGIISPEPVGARHALALLTAAMRQDAAAVFKEDKDLVGLVAASLASLEASGPIIGADAKKLAADTGRRSINLDDKWARVEMARLCAAAVYADWTSTQEFVKAIGASFWKMLCLLATRDTEHLVAMEAIRSMFGGVPSAGRSQSPAAAAAEEARNVKLRVRAWLFVVSQAGKHAARDQGSQPADSGTLLGAVGARLCQALSSTASAPLVCSACRSAGAMLEAATRAAGRSGKNAGAMTAESQRVLKLVIRQLGLVAEGFGAAVARSTAVEALLWSQVSQTTAVVSPVSLARSVSSPTMPWPKDLLRGLLECIYQVLRATPAAAPQLLQVAGTVAACAASSVQADQLLELWSAALNMGQAGKTAALSAALNVLANSSNPTIAPTSKGAPQKALTQAAANEAGWQDLLKNAAWWVGEHANLAANEFAGHLPPPDHTNENEARPEEAANHLERTALKAFRNPQMAAVVAQLQHAALTLPPGPRTAAVQALAKVAVRSEEPYRLHCYSILASLDTSHNSSMPDVHGVACVVQPVLPILDMIYSSRLVLQRLAVRYGNMPQKWPPALVAQLRQRHNLLEQRVQRVICNLQSASYFPMGPLSRDLLTSGIEALAPGNSLPEHNLANLKTASSMTSPDTSRQQSPYADGTARGMHTRNNSMLSEGQQTPLFSGVDPLAALTENLNQHITAEAFKPRGPAPWQIALDQARNSIPEEDYFGFADRDTPADTLHRKQESQGNSYMDEGVQHVRERGVVLHAFDAEVSDELSVYQGEEVDIEAEVDGWLHCVARTGQKGLVPASYIRILGQDESAHNYGPRSPVTQVYHQPSLDLLNEPDMLAALTAPMGDSSWGDDAWGSPHAYDTRQPHSVYDLPPTVSGDVVMGTIAIPEHKAEEEPESSEVSEYDVPLHQASLPSPAASDTIAFEDNPFSAESTQTRSQAEGQVEPSSPSSISTAPLPAAEHHQRAASPSHEDPSPLFSSDYAPDKLPPVTTARSLGRGEQPLSARMEFESPLASAPSGGVGPSRFARQQSVAESTPSQQASQDMGNGSQPIFNELPSITSMRHSRQSSLDTAEQLRKGSFDSGQTPVHRRLTSFDSAAGTPQGSRHSRQSSVDHSILSYRAVVLYGFDGETDDELTVAAGDAVVVSAEIEGWLQVTRITDGLRGLVPASYVSRAQ